MIYIYILNFVIMKNYIQKIKINKMKYILLILFKPF